MPAVSELQSMSLWPEKFIWIRWLPEKPKKQLVGYALTPKEEEVMRLFSRWMKRKEIAHALKITRVGVNAHCMNIAYKLDLNSPVAFYREAIRRYGNPDVV